MSGTPPTCSGNVDVTLRYTSNEGVDIDYTISVSGLPDVVGNIVLPPSTGTDTYTLTFTIPFPLSPDTDISASISALGMTTSVSVADVAAFVCGEGYTAPPTSSPNPLEPDVIVPPEPTDGRLDISSVHGVVYYDGDGVFSVYTLDENSNGVLAIQFTEAEKDALPDFPAVNMLIEQNADKTVSLYKLTTGEYQLNLGPDFEGKVRVFIFNDFPPSHVFTTEFVVGG
jgi:hypothetical protein